MPKYLFHMGVTLRCYGNVEVEADSIEAATAMMTADYLADRIEIHETTTDSGQDLAVIDVTDMEGNQIYGEDMGELPPNPYDPQPDAELLAALKRCVDQLSGKRPRKTNNRRAKLDFDLELAIAEAGKAIAKAEGRANG
jgi:hypothetical protein